jgi:hypothetical protein
MLKVIEGPYYMDSEKADVYNYLIQERELSEKECE